MSHDDKRYPCLSDKFQDMSDEEIDALLPEEFKGMRRIMTHPGELLEDAMGISGLSKEFLKSSLGLSEDEFQTLKAGKLHLTEELAQKMADCIEGNKEMLLRMQENHYITKRVFDPQP